MDLFSLAIVLALAAGALGADAAINANTLGIYIKVPALTAATMIESEFAEEVFATEISRMMRAPSVLSSPSVRSSTEPSVVSVISKAMGFEHLTYAVQQSLGLEPVKLSGMLIPGDQLRFIMTASSSQTGPFTIDVRSNDGDAVGLVKQAAHATVERVEPYRAALYHFNEAVEANSNDFSAVERVAVRDQEQRLKKSVRERQALFDNLLGIIALMRNDLDDADRRFTTLVAEHPRFAVGHLNLAFLRIHQKRFEEATRSAHRMLSPRRLTRIPELVSAAYLAQAIAAWGDNDFHAAQDMFARAVKAYPGTTAAYEYWSRMLVEMGRLDEAEEKRQLGVANLPYFENYPEVAMLYFDCSPREQGELVRR